MIFVDTNYFLRFLLKDVNAQHKKAKQLFENAALGKAKLFTSTIVFFEIDWVLSSFYQQKKAKRVKVLVDILKMDFIKMESKDLLLKAIETFKKTNLNLEDSFNLVYAKKMDARDFKTFDRELSNKFKKMKK